MNPMAIIVLVTLFVICGVKIVRKIKKILKKKFR